jgi:hypothetical protein
MFRTKLKDSTKDTAFRILIVSGDDNHDLFIHLPFIPRIGEKLILNGSIYRIQDVIIMVKPIAKIAGKDYNDCSAVLALELM